MITSRFGSTDEVRTFEKGKFEVLKVGHLTLGRATYEPGWKWSEQVGPAVGASSFQSEHIGRVLSGRCCVLLDSGREVEMKAGDIFEIGPGHDRERSRMCLFT